MSGVIDVAILSVIRRWYLREGVPIREIARRTRLSRNTIRKYLASGVVEPNLRTQSRLDCCGGALAPSGSSDGYRSGAVRSTATGGRLT